MNKYIYIIIAGALLITASCKKPYLPPVINSANSYLVVEGVINSGSDSTSIKLSRTVNISSKVTLNPVSGAALTVESDQNAVYPLSESKKGTYVSAGLNLDNSRKYRLRIKTSDNKQYVSDFVAVENSPPIDSIYYSIQSNGLTILANTHDPKNNTRYYRWQYNETWMFHSNFDSFFKSNGDTVLGRDRINDNISTCWANDTSSTIILNSSAKLSNDVIVANPITEIPSSSEKVGIKYSIQVTQYALTGDAYTFWTNLKKNTEQLGSIFDAQPSQINGNIHSVSDPGEAVVGYISVGSTSTVRIFVANQQLPYWVTIPFYSDCLLDTALYAYPQGAGRPPINQVDQLINYNRGAGSNPLIPVNALGMPGHPPIGYTASSRECVDCTLRGTNKQPAFWK